MHWVSSMTHKRTHSHGSCWPHCRIASSQRGMQAVSRATATNAPHEQVHAMLGGKIYNRHQKGQPSSVQHDCKVYTYHMYIYMCSIPSGVSNACRDTISKHVKITKLGCMQPHLGSAVLSLMKRRGETKRYQTHSRSATRNHAHLPLTGVISSCPRSIKDHTSTTIIISCRQQAFSMFSKR
jgi:hypothetical protein